MLPILVTGYEEVGICITILSGKSEMRVVVEFDIIRAVYATTI
jgi:hypothetical protein